MDAATKKTIIDSYIASLEEQLLRAQLDVDTNEGLDWISAEILAPLIEKRDQLQQALDNLKAKHSPTRKPAKQ